MAFLDAEDEPGDQGYAATSLDLRAAASTRLRQTTSIDVDWDRFRFEDVVSNDQLVLYIADREHVATFL